MSGPPVGRDEAARLDAADPLAGLRERFVIADPARIYLDGNSLGRLSVDVRRALHEAIDDWADRVVEGWNDWVELPARAGDRLARVALGARDGEVLVADSVTVNLYKLAHAAAEHRPGPIVTDAANFPTDRYVLEGVAHELGRDYIEAPSVDAAIDAAGSGVLCLSHVDYRTGALLDMAAITRSTDALVIWDVCHSVGAVEVELAVADLAVGCTYKYLNAGPGAPAFLYVRRELQAEMRSPIQGWFGQRNQFAMGAGFDPVDGVERFAAGTPSVPGVAAVDAAVGLVEEASIGRIAAKGRQLTELAVGLFDRWLAPLGLELASPRQPHLRGAHVALRHPDAWPICRALIDRAGVVVDFRQPDIVRLGFSPLTTRFADVWDGLDRLRDVVATRDYAAVEAARRVT
ncbi:MAG: aminotransferase class V-fold PLP-dependent enzyme [Chloroflexota bacterium]|nr:aminotransferase class V-fold PLP-dependent enzyme [Chloroflexota bacterium]